MNDEVEKRILKVWFHYRIKACHAWPISVFIPVKVQQHSFTHYFDWLNAKEKKTYFNTEMLFVCSSMQINRERTNKSKNMIDIWRENRTQYEQPQIMFVSCSRLSNQQKWPNITTEKKNEESTNATPSIRPSFTRSIIVVTSLADVSCARVDEQKTCIQMVNCIRQKKKKNKPADRGTSKIITFEQSDAMFSSFKKRKKHLSSGKKTKILFLTNHH